MERYAEEDQEGADPRGFRDLRGVRGQRSRHGDRVQLGRRAVAQRVCEEVDEEPARLPAHGAERAHRDESVFPQAAADVTEPRRASDGRHDRPHRGRRDRKGRRRRQESRRRDRLRDDVPRQKQREFAEALAGRAARGAREEVWRPERHAFGVSRVGVSRGFAAA